MNQEYQNHLYTVARRQTIAFMVIDIIGILANLFLISQVDLIAAMEIIPVPIITVIATVVLLIAAAIYHYRNLQILNRQEIPLALPWYLNSVTYLLFYFRFFMMVLA